MMKELQEQWKVMSTKIEKINRDCKHFGKDPPKLGYYDKMKEEIEEQQEAWSAFDEFQKELDQIRKEEWLTYRKQKYFAFQDFFLAFAEKVKKAPKTTVSRFILE